MTPTHDSSMYTPLEFARAADVDFDIVHLVQYLIDWIAVALGHLKDFSIHIIRNAWSWLTTEFLPSLTPREIFYQIFERPSQWPVLAFYFAWTFFKTHPHVVHIISFSIFFGPIIVLLPLLLIHELCIALLFNLSFVMHGAIPGSTDEFYTFLRSSFMNTRESLFASVDAAGTTYNKWTTDFVPLVILRIAALGLGCYALYEIRSNMV